MAYIGQSLTEGTRRVYTYVATASQTTFNAVYGVGAVDVYQNGVLLQPSDYTATDGTSVVLDTGAALSDEITIVCHNTFSVADTVSASQGGTFSQPVTIDGDGATVLTVDRATSDGTIIDVQKDGTTVGSIGTAGSLYIASGDTGLRFADATPDRIMPVNGSGSVRDDAITLGFSTARFKDLYLSGGVYLGGTGSANHLDDYEEGTWTPSSPDGAMQATNGGGNRYTKIGNLVYCEMDTQFFTSTSGSYTRIRGMPFTPLTYGTGNVGWSSIGKPTDIHVSTSDIYIMDNDASRHLTYSEASGARIIASFMYTTNS